MSATRSASLIITIVNPANIIKKNIVITILSVVFMIQVLQKNIPKVPGWAR